MPTFQIEDDHHHDAIGEFSSLEATWAELRRLAALPFAEEPNLPPCTKGAECRRTYEIVEYDDSGIVVNRTYVLHLTARGANWKVIPPRDL